LLNLLALYTTGTGNDQLSLVIMVKQK